jgi:hypothetical protein
MANTEEGLPKAKRRGRDSISRIAISGYKSINCEQTVRIAPLTVLAGANSSGKSSIMQPLLLLKQTLEAPYDPGPLLINGPNVKFTTAEQMFSHCGKQLPHEERLAIAIELHGEQTLTMFYRRSRQKLEIEKMTYSGGQFRQTFHMAMSDAEIRRALPKYDNDLFRSMSDAVKPAKLHWRVALNRCFLELALLSDEHEQTIYRASPSQSVAYHVRDIIHLPGLRGNPERTYPVTAVGKTFPGSFDKYAASVIAKWQADKQLKELHKVGDYLELLGLTWKVATDAVDETQVQLKVGRLPHAARGGAHDLVSIADVGVGTSQALPIVVALVVARPGQLVYIEQPEIHLHPAAQAQLAEVLADAARRGVRIVAETHSSTLLLAIQTIVASGRLAPDDVSLNWFTRDNSGVTSVTAGILDETGAFGDWPEDFGSAILSAEADYVEAASRRLRKIS